MKLADHYFVYGGTAFRFKVFADKSPTKTRLHSVVKDAFGGGLMEVYQIETLPDTRWVVVVEYAGSQNMGDVKYTYFVRNRQGELETTRDLEAVTFLREQVKSRDVRTRAKRKVAA